MAEKTIKVNKAFLKKVAFRVNEMMLERFDSEPSTLPEGYEPSEKFTRAMEGLIEKQRKKKNLRVVKTVLVVAAVLAMLFACAMSVAAIRRALYNFFMSFYDDYAVVSYEVVDNGDAAAYSETSLEIEVYYEPTYIPAGYEKMESTKSELLYKITYKNESFSYYYKQEVINNVTVVDYENDILNSTEINGFPAFYSIDEHNENLYLMWSNDEYLYTISCNSSSINYEEVVRIAESLSVVK